MSGKPKQKQYQYSSKEDGFKYIRSYESATEVFNKYYNGKKGELYHNNKPYKELPDGTFIAPNRIGREGLRYCTRIFECPLVGDRKGDKVIEMYNILGEKIGEIKNRRVLEAIMGNKITSNAVNISLHRNKRTTTTSIGVPSFVYKEEVMEQSYYIDKEGSHFINL